MDYDLLRIDDPPISDVDKVSRNEWRESKSLIFPCTSVRRLPFVTPLVLADPDADARGMPSTKSATKGIRLPLSVGVPHAPRESDKSRW